MPQHTDIKPELVLKQARNSVLIPKHPDYLQEFSGDYIKARDLFEESGNQVMSNYVQQILND